MKQLIILYFSLLLTKSLTAQSWQWGQRGGGFSNGLNNTPRESIVDMDTDPNGNVYIIAVIEASGFPTIGGQAVKKYKNRDILVASFNCNGSTRWFKTIGGNNDDVPVAIRTDTLGHVYVAGAAAPNNTHFDSDSAQPNSVVKSLFLLQYDTSGNFKWMHHPTPDTPVSYSESFKYRVLDMIADKNGDTYMLCFMNKGLLAGGGNYQAPATGVYVLKYDVAGNIAGLTRM